MGVVTQWLEGIGLPPPVVANFRAAGIVRPDDLLSLEVLHYEALGVTSAADRRKLFFLVQRLKQAQTLAQQQEEEMEEGGGGKAGGSSSDSSAESEESSAGSGAGHGAGGGAGSVEMPPPPPPPPPANDDGDDDGEAAAAAAAAAKKPQPQQQRRNTRSRRTAASSTTSVLESATSSSTSALESAASQQGTGGTATSRRVGARGGGRTAAAETAAPTTESSHASTSSQEDAATTAASPASSVENYDSPNRPPARRVGTKASKAKKKGVQASKEEMDNDHGKKMTRTRVGGNAGVSSASSSTHRGRSRSPVRRTTTRSAAAAGVVTASEGGETTSAAAARSTTTSSSGRPSRSRSPVRMTNAANARAAAIRARSRSPVRSTTPDPANAGTTLAGAGTAAARARARSRSRSPVRSRSPGSRRRPGKATTRTTAGAGKSLTGGPTSRGTSSRGTMAAGSPTKTSGTQTTAARTRMTTAATARSVQQQSARRRKAPAVDLAEDVDTDDSVGGGDEIPSTASRSDTAVATTKKKGTSPRRPATATNGTRGRSAATASGRSSRSLLSKQSSLPSLQSRSSNLSDEGSVGSNKSSSARSTSSAGSGGKSTKRRSTGAAGIIGSGATGSGSSRPVSSAGIRAGKRPSKLPGPSKIPTRTGGKGLSTIPAERAAIMSPLVKIHLDGGEAINGGLGLRRGISYDGSDDDDDEGCEASTLRRRSGSLSSTGSVNGRRRLSAPLARAKSSSDLSSDEDRRDTKRAGKRRDTSSIGSGRQSLGLTRPRSRNSSIGLPSKVEITAAGGRKVSPPRRSGTPESERTDSVASSEIDLSAELETGTVFVQGMPEDKSWGTQVSRLREDQNRAHEMEFGPPGPLRDYDEDVDDMRIRVVVRKRPMSRSEAALKDDFDVIHPLEYCTYGKIMVYQPKTRVDLTKEVESLPFAFDNVFDETSNNSEIYERTVSGLIPAVFDGQFCNVFAYGQTGSGKTFTMMGSNLTGANAGNQDDTNPGLYYLAAQDVFYLANEAEFQHLTVTASLFEIYSGKLFDLLNCRSPIKCLEDHRGKVCFPGLTEHTITSAAELMQLMEDGAANRSTGTTSKNADSSRSHAVLQISLKSNHGRKAGVEHGRLTLIDLAGAERGADTSQASRATRLEGAEINTSLLALKEVIRALATGDSMKHIPFRGSKLTQVLKESFVGKNNRTVMVACVAPNINNCEHTLNTLRYADRVKERDAQSGNVAAAVAEASSVIPHSKKPTAPTILSPLRHAQRPATAPVGVSRSFDSGRSKDSFQDLLDADDSDDDNLLDDDDEEEDRRATSDSLILDRLLGDDTDDEHSASAIPKPPTNRETAQSLIETHRNVMAEMLQMVKREMTLVNSADANRDTMDEYLQELEAAQEKQLGLISSLREALLGYYASR